MAIVRWRPSNDLAGLHSAVDRLFSDMFGTSYRADLADDGGNGGAGDAPTYFLPVNVAETENGYRIEAPVPGFRPEDVEITFSEGVLTINARRQAEREEREGTYLRREVMFGNYQRHITVPGDVQADGITASFENGVLTVDVPRPPKPEPKRIEVRAGQMSEQRQVTAGAGSERRS